MNQFYLDNLITELIKNVHKVDHSLMYGKPGILIALSYYYRFCLNKKLEKEVVRSIEFCIDEMISDVENKQLDGSLAFGLTGISYALQTSEDLLGKKSDKNWFDELNQLIIQSLEYNLINKEYDFLRGASGIIIYLLNYYPNEKYIEKYIDCLYKSSIWINDSMCHWIFYSFNEEKKVLEYRDDIINLGLAHGMSGIISILSELFQNNYKQKKCYKLIEGGINFLKSIELNNSNPIQFQGIINKTSEKQNFSRLGWCYGDSGLGLSILKAGLYCKNKEWKEYGNKICLKSTNRSLKNAGLDEHGICHGYFGTMHIYNRLYLTTGNIKYKLSKEYWRKIGFEKREFDLNEFGFFQTELSNTNEIRKYSSNGILQGLAGIFLCIASNNEIQYSWDEIFLINIDEN